jgi:hypothetical protein
MYGAAAPIRSNADRAFWNAWQAKRDRAKARKLAAYQAKAERQELQRALDEAGRLRAIEADKVRQAHADQMKRDQDEADRIAAGIAGAAEKNRLAQLHKPLDLAALIQALHDRH